MPAPGRLLLRDGVHLQDDRSARFVPPGVYAVVADRDGYLLSGPSRFRLTTDALARLVVEGFVMPAPPERTPARRAA